MNYREALVLIEHRVDGAQGLVSYAAWRILSGNGCPLCSITLDCSNCPATYDEQGREPCRDATESRSAMRWGILSVAETTSIWRSALAECRRRLAEAETKEVL